MKLKRKIRFAGKVKRQYDIPRTPYQRLIESGQIAETVKRELKILYQTLNPAELKRTIDRKTHELYKAYEEKRKGGEATPFKKQTPRTVTNYMIQQPLTGLPHDMI